MNLKPNGAQQRILAAAVTLFSRKGYNGASTRDIANLAEVNEVTVYRYFSSKRELFISAVESELSRISLGGDEVTLLANASDSRAALLALFGLIADTASRHPEMVRLLQFAALEIGEELEPLCRKHLGGLLEMSAGYLGRWINAKESLCGDPRLLILAFISSAIGIETLFPVLWGEKAPLPSKVQVSACADIWSTALFSSGVSS